MSRNVTPQAYDVTMFGPDWSTIRPGTAFRVAPHAGAHGGLMCSEIDVHVHEVPKPRKLPKGGSFGYVRGRALIRGKARHVIVYPQREERPASIVVF